MSILSGIHTKEIDFADVQREVPGIEKGDWAIERRHGGDISKFIAYEPKVGEVYQKHVLRFIDISSDPRRDPNEWYQEHKVSAALNDKCIIKASEQRMIEGIQKQLTELIAGLKARIKRSQAVEKAFSFSTHNCSALLKGQGE